MSYGGASGATKCCVGVRGVFDGVGGSWTCVSLYGFSFVCIFEAFWARLSP